MADRPLGFDVYITKEDSHLFAMTVMCFEQFHAQMLIDVHIKPQWPICHFSLNIVQ